MLSRRKDIEDAFQYFARDPDTQKSYLHEPIQKASNAEETRIVPDPRDPTKNVEIKTPVPSIEISGEQAALLRLSRMSAAEIDPAVTGSAASAEAAKKGEKPE